MLFENTSAGSVIGSPNAPYFNQLASTGANFTSSFAIEHPSQPNYLDLFSGSNQGVTDDSCPHTFSSDNEGAQLIAKGLTFSSYSEDLPATGSTTCGSGRYARKHAPWTNFTNVPASNSKPFSAFPTDFTQLPTVSWVIPNLCNDMHDCSVSTGDNWLKAHLDAYVQWAKTHNSILITTFDEDDYSGNNRIATIVNGQPVKPGSYAEHIDHFDVLRTVEDMYGLPYAGAAAQATPITDAWATSADVREIFLQGGLAMDDPASSATAGTQLIVWGRNGGANQRWSFQPNTDGTVTIKNSASGQCLDNAASSTTAGTKIIQWPCTGGANQRWTVVSSGSGYALLSKVSGLAITATGTTNGSVLTQQPNSRTVQQTWSFATAG
ncbi:hypothetical protein JOF29_007258 [Kribbella aluminosa]|uniref:Ricin B lectin domain-containing protein n=1 Tax=Kribbella aluminosa TaxID=416017 RepID=A0ABS4UWV9_9ACTN|nr:RICIN domain-containing protein [Kribbella aluminosa]MBP2356148.1 hypothetical protein [Kribbella aluminosa]